METQRGSDDSLSFRAFVRIVIDALEAANVEYLIGGSWALAIWGELRSTADVDFVVNLPAEQMYPLSKELEKRDMLVPFDIIVDLYLQSEGDLPINAIHLKSGYKAELFLLRPGDPFRAMALSRKRLANMGPDIGQVYVHSPEDLIIYKLRYHHLSEQPKHLRDIRSILIENNDQLDFAYIEHWVTYWGISSAWYKARNYQKPIAQ